MQASECMPSIDLVFWSRLLLCSNWSRLLCQFDDVVIIKGTRNENAAVDTSSVSVAKPGVADRVRTAGLWLATSVNRVCCTQSLADDYPNKPSRTLMFESHRWYAMVLVLTFNSNLLWTSKFDLASTTAVRVEPCCASSTTNGTML